MGMAELINKKTGMVAPEQSEGERSEPSRSGRGWPLLPDWCQQR